MSNVPAYPKNPISHPGNAAGDAARQIPRVPQRKPRSVGEYESDGEADQGEGFRGDSGLTVKFQRFIEETPVSAVLIAAGVGILAGWLVRR